MVNIATALPSAPFICTHYCQYPRCRHVHKRICNFTSAKWRIQITQLAFKLLIAAHTDQPGRQGGRAPLYFASPLLPTLTLISAAPGKTEVQYPGSPLPLLTWGRTDDTICNAHLRLLKADMAAVMTAGVSVYSDAAIAAAVVGASHCQLNTPPPGPHAVIVSPLPPSTWPPVPWPPSYIPPLDPFILASSLVSGSDISSSVSYLSPPSALMKLRARSASTRDRLLLVSSVASISLYTYIFP